MSVTVNQFLTAHPEFQAADAGRIQFWLDIAAETCPAERWMHLTDLGIMLFTAHNLKLEIDATASGGGSGAIRGPATSKRVDNVSVSYDSGSVVSKDGGMMNATPYGIQFEYWMRIVGTTVAIV